MFGVKGEKSNRGESAFLSDGTDKGINRRDSRGDNPKSSGKRKAQVVWYTPYLKFFFQFKICYSIANISMFCFYDLSFVIPTWFTALLKLFNNWESIDLSKIDSLDKF